MKRMTALTALLLAAFLSVVSVLSWGLPDGEYVAGPARLTDGRVLVGENQRFTSRIYTLRDGFVDKVYEESRLSGGEERRVARLTTVNDAVFYLREINGGEVWELAELRDGKSDVLFRGSFNDPITITGLRGTGDTFWITGLGSNGAVVVYEYTPARGARLMLIIPVWWLRDAVSAEYDGSSIRATTAYGDSCFMTPYGDAFYTDEAEESPVPVFSAEGRGWLLCKRVPLRLAAVLWLTVSAVLWAAYLIGRGARRIAVRMTAVGSAVLLLAFLSAELAAFAAVSVLAGLLTAWRTAVPLGGILAAVWLIGTLLLYLTGRYMTAPVAAMTRQMDRVSDGDSAAREASVSKDELGQMDRSLQMMCMNLSVWDYEAACTIRSYKRFVPEKMAELLNRPVVEEIRLGDSRRMTGNVGVFSVGNRSEARASLEDAAFVDFVNHSFGVFYDCTKENRGWIVSSGLRLSAMEALFPDAPTDGVQAGLDFLGKLRVQHAEDVPEARACLILHRASFLYGIAGRDDRLFPYLSSSELNFLGSYAPKLDEAGVRIVATEAYWNQLSGCGFTARYIGFVSAGERGSAYKLYEILDAYSALERDLRCGYDSRFQEAINLFYRNDFYLARNLFSTLLRACPGDGVARWYLFACERFFHEEGSAKVDYSLFGTEL